MRSSGPVVQDTLDRFSFTIERPVAADIASMNEIQRYTEDGSKIAENAACQIRPPSRR